MQGARRFASNSTLRSMVCFALVAALHTTVHADAPGMLLYTGTSIGQRAFEAPFRKFSKLGQHGIGSVNGTTFPLTAILPGGEPFVFADDPASPYRSHPSDLRPLTDIAYAINSVLAVQDDGWVRSWGPSTHSWLPPEPVVDLSVSPAYVACVGQSGQVHVWNHLGPVPHSTTSGDATQVSLATMWGLVKRSNGSLETFTYLDGTTPAITLPTGVRDLAATGGPTTPRAIAIIDDGSMRSLNSPFVEQGDFRKVVLNAGRMITLDGAGRAKWSTWNSQTQDWNPLTEIPGCFDDVGVPSIGSPNVMYAICSTDSDRNGEEDRLQILRGEMVDVNGDLVHDAVQPPTILLDEDENGTIDALESATISGRKKPSDATWYGSGPVQQLVGMIALDRIPANARSLRTIRLQHALSTPFGSSIAGRPVRYGIWLDPNGDGSPTDAVQVFEGEFVLNSDGVQSIDLDGLWIGPPGTCIFHGLLYNQPSGQSQIAIYTSYPPSSPITADPFAVSRRRCRNWFRASVSSIPNLTSTQAAREAQAFELWSHHGNIPSLCLTWNERLPTDADSDGALDVFTCGAAEPRFWMPEPDRDSDGIPDGTSPDCDGDGSLDILAIAAGGSDCDSNLVADGCTAVEYWMPSQAPPAVSGSHAVRRWTLRALPRPLGAGTLLVEASAALADAATGLSLRIEGGEPLEIFVTDGDDCASPANSISIPLEETQLATLVADEVLAVEITAIGDSTVTACPDAFVRIGLQYTIRAAECVANGIPDRCEGTFPDCNGNGLDDGCELDDPANDVDGNGTLDACQFDCDRDGVPDAYELSLDPSLDCDASGYLDACEFVDCDGNGVHDPCQTTAPADDCNSDGIPDVCQSLADADGDGTPDVCECPADISGDGFVTGMDLSLLMMSWGTVGDSAGDIDRDGDVDAQDLSILLEAWGVCGS